MQLYLVIYNYIYIYIAFSAYCTVQVLEYYYSVVSQPHIANV